MIQNGNIVVKGEESSRASLLKQQAYYNNDSKNEYKQQPTPTENNG